MRGQHRGDRVLGAEVTQVPFDVAVYLSPFGLNSHLPQGRAVSLFQLAHQGRVRPGRHHDPQVGREVLVPGQPPAHVGGGVAEAQLVQAVQEHHDPFGGMRPRQLGQRLEQRGRLQGGRMRHRDVNDHLADLHRGGAALDDGRLEPGAQAGWPERVGEVLGDPDRRHVGPRADCGHDDLGFDHLIRGERLRVQGQQLEPDQGQERGEAALVPVGVGVGLADASDEVARPVWPFLGQVGHDGRLTGAGTAGQQHDAALIVGQVSLHLAGQPDPVDPP